MINSNLKLDFNRNILQINVNNTGILFFTQITSFILVFNSYRYPLGAECLKILLFTFSIALIMNFFEYSNLETIFTDKYNLTHLWTKQKQHFTCGGYE